MTVRNWLLGYYIVTFEQRGEDRAAYGEGLLQKLAERLDKEGFSYWNLKIYRQFYQTYSYLGSVAFPLLQTMTPIGQTLSAQLEVLPEEANRVGVLSPDACRFNRWGKRVFYSPHYQNQWDGGDLPAGIYFYALTHACLSGSVRGMVQLQR